MEIEPIVNVFQTSLKGLAMVYLCAMTGMFFQYQTMLAWVSGISLLLFAGSLAAVPWLLAKMPQDYFEKLADHRPAARLSMGGWLLRIMKNGLGLLLFGMGVVMLFIPGQGLLTMLVGLVLLDFPGRHRLLLRLASAKKVQAALNWIRIRKGVPPFRFPF